MAQTSERRPGRTPNADPSIATEYVEFPTEVNKTSASVPAGSDITHPYRAAAQRYFSQGWDNPIPIGNRSGEKTPPPPGVTGKEGTKVGWGQINAWKADKGHLNIGIRLQSMMAFDVDGPEAVAALAAMTEDVGTPLPATFTSTARGPESERRHHFYRVPFTLELAGVEGVLRKRYGDKLDLLHKAHRYAVVAPSIHPDGGRYTWYGPDGQPTNPQVPNTKDVPALPDEWVAFLAAQLQSAAPASATVAEDPWDTPGASTHHMTRAQVDAAWARAVAKFSEEYREGNRNNAIRDLAFQAWHYSSAYSLDDVVDVVDRLGRERFGFPRVNHEDGATMERAWADARDKGQWVAEIGEAEEDEFWAEHVPATGAATSAEPEDRYTDAQMSGRLSREVLAGRYVYTKGMGWLRWTGQRWAEVADEVIHEDTRKWTLAGYLAAVETWKRAAAAGATDKPIHEDPDVMGWAGMQGLGRIRSAAMLARGIVMRDAAEFDKDPDLLNTPAGVVDLRTGQVMPHDPARLITKVTAVGYVPGAECPALKAALEAVPDDARDWLQLRLGEAITGHSGEQMVLLTGGGRNGKTLLMGSAFRTLGGYAAKVPSTLLLKTRQTGGATPERMTLRGIRLAYMEETPEDGYLDSAVVKDLLDAEEIEGRHLYRDIVSWRPTHSLFLNTNHAPTMKDTGDGAWRRLTRLDFPYRFRKTGEALELPTDRHGDPHLKAALGGSQEGQEALLAWLVAGAIRCYATGSVEEAGPDPASVRAAVQRWREESDALLLFIRDVLTFDSDAWVTNADLFRAYARWAKDNHMEGMASRTFFKRLEVHSALTNRVGKTQRRITASAPSRPGHLLVDGLLQPLPARPEGWAGLAFQGSDQEE